MKDNAHNYQIHQTKAPSMHPLQSPLKPTPVNLILLSLFVILAYLRLRPKATPTLSVQQPPTVFKTFTPPTLLPYSGKNNAPVYLAVRGRVFDVTPGRNFYGPGGPYANFAGRDATRGLACGSFDADMLTEDLQGPLDTLGDLGEEEMEALKGWEERFNEKYLVVGRLVPVGSEEAKGGEGEKRGL
ncbi:Dihydrodipicolinate synthase [Elasticomyces elasticus]|nr:Dihydrodipicolinate synthase [Elasticomyces elasticus]